MTITTELQTRIDAVTPATSDQDLLILCKAVEPDLQDYDITIILAETDRRLLEADSGDSSSDLLILVKCSEALGGGSGGSSESFRVNDIKQVLSNQDNFTYPDGEEWLKTGVTKPYSSEYAGATVTQASSFAEADSSMVYPEGGYKVSELNISSPTAIAFRSVEYIRSKDEFLMTTNKDLIRYTADCGMISQEPIYDNPNIAPFISGSANWLIYSTTSNADWIFISLYNTALDDSMFLRMDHNYENVTKIWENTTNHTRAYYIGYDYTNNYLLIYNGNNGDILTLPITGGTPQLRSSTTSSWTGGVFDIDDNYFALCRGASNDDMYFVSKADFSLTARQDPNYMGDDCTYLPATKTIYGANSSSIISVTRILNMEDKSVTGSVAFSTSTSMRMYGNYFTNTAHSFYDSDDKLKTFEFSNASSSGSTSAYITVTEPNAEGYVARRDGRRFRDRTLQDNAVNGTGSAYEEDYWGSLEYFQFHPVVSFPNVTYRNVRNGVFRETVFSKGEGHFERVIEKEIPLTDPRMGTERMPQLREISELGMLGVGSDATNIYAIFGSPEKVEVYTITASTMSVTNKTTLSGMPRAYADGFTSYLTHCTAVAGGFLFISKGGNTYVDKYNLSTGAFVQSYTVASVGSIFQSDNTNNFNIVFAGDRNVVVEHNTNLVAGTSVTLAADLASATCAFLPTLGAYYDHYSTGNKTCSTTSASFSYNFNPFVCKVDTVYDGARTSASNVIWDKCGMVEVGGEYFIINCSGVHKVDINTTGSHTPRVIDFVAHNLDTNVFAYDKNPEGGVFAVLGSKCIVNISESGEVTFNRSVGNNTGDLAPLSLIIPEYVYDNSVTPAKHRVVMMDGMFNHTTGNSAIEYTINHITTDGTITTTVIDPDTSCGIGVDRQSGRWLVTMGSSSSSAGRTMYTDSYESTTLRLLTSVNTPTLKVCAFGAGFLRTLSIQGVFFYTDSGHIDQAFDIPCCLPYNTSGVARPSEGGLVIPTEDGYMCSLDIPSAIIYFDKKMKPLKSGRYVESIRLTGSNYARVISCNGFTVGYWSQDDTIKYWKDNDIGQDFNVVDTGSTVKQFGCLDGSIYQVSNASIAIPEVSLNPAPLPWFANTLNDYLSVTDFGTFGAENGGTYKVQENGLTKTQVVGSVVNTGDNDYVRIK